MKNKVTDKIKNIEFIIRVGGFCTMGLSYKPTIA